MFHSVTREGASWSVVSDWAARGILHGFGDASCNCATDVDAVGVDRLVVPKQVHGTDVLAVDSDDTIPVAGEFKQREADAVVVAGAGVAGGVLSADCTPVLILDTERVAACHCGWRSAVGGLLPKVLETLPNTNELELAIGPAAGIECYEIGPEVAVEVERAADIAKKKLPVNDALRQPIVDQRGGRIFCDIKQLLALQARAAGVPESGIYIHPSCTIEDLSFFSYRRQNGQAGRQVSFIQHRGKAQ